MEEQKKKSPAVIGGIIVLVLAIAGYGAFKYTKKDTAPIVAPVDNTFTPPVDTVTPPVTTPVNPVSSTYKDGTYSAKGSYNSPGGQEQIGVQVTLKNDVIVDATVTAEASRRESLNYQNKFVSGYKAQVIGKKITEVGLNKVSGSSLTPKGWNDAIAQIQTQAKA